MLGVFRVKTVFVAVLNQSTFYNSKSYREKLIYDSRLLNHNQLNKRPSRQKFKTIIVVECIFIVRDF